MVTAPQQAFRANGDVITRKQRCFEHSDTNLTDPPSLFNRLLQNSPFQEGIIILMPKHEKVDLSS